MIRKGIHLAVLLLMMPALRAQVFWNMASQSTEKSKKIYKGEKTRINDLEHTDLKLNFDLEAHTVHGKARIRLHPHFYTTDSLTLDAKSMQIDLVRVDGQKVVYDYDGTRLRIRLPRSYSRNESYEVEVVYTAYPDSIQTKGGTVITQHKGLYFINTRGETDAYPPHIWTQGEPEDNSAWFPTIESPNQKSTGRIELTVPGGWVTLSNGVQTASTGNPDGTRTDVWTISKPQAPYLFFIAAGPFVIVKDSLDGMPVWYYVEKKYENVAKQIFGKTPEMIRYFSRLTGVPYPWEKYHQIVTRQFVSGAMENTTAVNHHESAYQTPAELADENRWEDVIAHELFHHWFGDYVTAESWAQIAMNESFADYAESLWEEYDEGRDKADYLLEKQRKAYFLIPGNAKKSLIRYFYNHPDDVFDVVSYQKGGLILHMLRHEVGDSAFFEGMRRYLTQNKFGTGEAAKFRLALEEVSGKDLKLFFDQWFYGSGHPRLEIRYVYDDTKGEATVKILQKTEKIWKFPLVIDVYENEPPVTYHVTVDDSVETFRFPYQRRPAFINVGARHILLARIDDRRPSETYYFQFRHARNYMDRRMGLDEAVQHKDKAEAFEVIISALDDPFYIIRRDALKAIDPDSPYFTRKLEQKIYRMARHDKDNRVRAEAIRLLGKLKKRKYIPLFREAVGELSAAVSSAAFEAWAHTDENSLLKALKPEWEEKLGFTIIKFYIHQRLPGKRVAIAAYLRDHPYMFMQMGSDANTVSEGAEWIAASDDVEANRLLADAIYRLSEMLKNYSLQRMGLLLIHSYMKQQQKNEGPHRDEILHYYRQTLEKIKKL